MKCLTKSLTETNDKHRTKEVNLNFVMMEMLISSSRQAVLVDVH